jgi:hypothetical protein
MTEGVRKSDGVTKAESSPIYSWLVRGQSPVKSSGLGTQFNTKEVPDKCSQLSPGLNHLLLKRGCVSFPLNKLLSFEVRSSASSHAIELG